MFLFNKIGFNAFNGAIFASFIGYIISFLIALRALKKHEHFSYKQTLKIIPLEVLSLVVCIGICMIYKYLFTSPNTYIGNIIYLIIIGVIYCAVFYIFNKKSLLNILSDVRKEK